MSWRRRVIAVLLALVSGGCCFCATLRGQDGLRASDLEVFSDTQLPGLNEDEADAALPPAEELPPVRPNAFAPQIDPDVIEELPASSRPDASR